MGEQLFECGKCGQLTPYVSNTDKLDENIQHTFAECQQCGAKTTIFYTDKSIRNLMGLQQKTPIGQKTADLAKRILKKQNELKKI